MGAFAMACSHSVCVCTCSVEGVVCVEHGGEEAEGERADAEGHVEARVPERLEGLRERERARERERTRESGGERT